MCRLRFENEMKKSKTKRKKKKIRTHDLNESSSRRCRVTDIKSRFRLFVIKSFRSAVAYVVGLITPARQLRVLRH